MRDVLALGINHLLQMVGGIAAADDGMDAARVKNLPQVLQVSCSVGVIDEFLKRLLAVGQKPPGKLVLPSCWA